MEKHNLPLAGLVHLTAIVYILMIVFNALGGVGYAGLFSQSVGQVSDKYTVYITPAGFTFTIWSVIYIFLGAGAIYCVSSVYRNSEVTGKVYLRPVILNWVFYAALLANYALNTAWIFIWNNELIVAATIFLLFIAYMGWLAFLVACVRGKRAMEKKKEGVTKTAIFKEVRLQRILIHNGIAFYTTWTTIASLLNINVAFQYVGNFDPETISLICLSILLIILLTWFLFEHLWLDSYVRYTVSQYPVVIFATCGILSKQADPKRPDGPVPQSVQVLTWIVLGIACAQFIARISVVIYRYRTQPLHKTNPEIATIQQENIAIKNNI